MAGVHHGGEDMIQHQEQEADCHIFIYTQQRKWDKALNPQRLLPVTHLFSKAPPPEGAITSPNTTTNGDMSLLETFLIQTTTHMTPLSYFHVDLLANYKSSENSTLEEKKKEGVQRC